MKISGTKAASAVIAVVCLFLGGSAHAATSITIDPTVLSVPAGNYQMRLQELGTEFRSATTFSLADGT